MQENGAIVTTFVVLLLPAGMRGPGAAPAATVGEVVTRAAGTAKIINEGNLKQ